MSAFESTAEKMFLPAGMLQSFETAALPVSWTTTATQHPPYQGVDTSCPDLFPGPMVLPSLFALEKHTFSSQWLF